MFTTIEGLTDAQASRDLDRGDERIIKVERIDDTIQDIGAAEAKAMPPGRRYRYSFRIRYTSTSGKTHNSTCRAMTKPKLIEAWNREQSYVQRGMTWLSLNYDKTNYVISFRSYIS